jgi:hypothetical protein
LEKKNRILELRDAYDSIVAEPPYRMFVPFHYRHEGRPILLFPLLATSPNVMRVWEDTNQPHDGFYPGVPEYSEEIILNRPLESSIHGHTFRFE